MAWKQMDIHPSSLHELHVANVYNDPDFNDDIEKIVPNHIAFMKRYHPIGGASKRKMTAQIEQSKEAFNDLAKKYRIKPIDVNFFITGQNEGGLVPKEDMHRTELVVDDYGQFTAYFDDTITKAEILELWDTVSEYKKSVNDGKTSRNKPPVYDKLVYAIFKARVSKDKPTFVAIYWLYQEDKLKGYDMERGRKNKIFTSAEALEKYYRRNQPKL